LRLLPADLMAVLLVKYLKYDWDHPGHPNNDRLIFSKGHASPLLYAMYKAAGAITHDELMSLRTFGSRHEGHPNRCSADDHGTPRGAWVDATGPSGRACRSPSAWPQRKYIDKRRSTGAAGMWLAEGSIWEAFDKAGHHQLTTDRHSGHEPTGPAGTDGTRVGCTRRRRPRPRLRVACHRDRRPRHRRH
jgi:transketolase